MRTERVEHISRIFEPLTEVQAGRLSVDQAADRLKHPLKKIRLCQTRPPPRLAQRIR